MKAKRPRFEDHRAHVAALQAAALAAADSAAAVRRWLSPADLGEAAHVYVVGAGKAGVAMANAAAEIVGERLTAGVMAVPSAPAEAPARLSFIEGGHPQPTDGSLTGGRAVAALLSRAQPGDLVLALISGGASALLELPRAGLTLADLQRTNAALLRSGAAVDEINKIRARLSLLKGGGLAMLAYPARVLGLILSDVVGNPLGSIGSGPTVAAPKALAAEAVAVVDRYGLRPELPAVVLRHLAHGTEALGQAEPVVENRLVGSNRMACEAVVAAARDLGFAPELAADDWQGEARKAGQRLAELMLDARVGQSQPRCLVAGGESTVAVHGSGRGGRNQEAAVAAAMALAGVPGMAAATLATDGVDGPTEAAGGLVTGNTLAQAAGLGLDPKLYLDDNDSYSFLEAVGGLVVTGPTGTNVNDLLIGLVYLTEQRRN